MPSWDFFRRSRGAGGTLGAVSEKPSKGAGKRKEQSVLGNLPSTRPSRIGRRREEGSGTSAKPAAPAARTRKASPAKATPAKAKPKPQAKATPSKPKAAPTPKPTAAKPRPVPGGDSSRRVEDRSGQGGPQPVRAGAAPLDGSGLSPEDRGASPPDPPSGTELVTTVVQAAGELAQIGVTVGGQILKRAVSRLPKP